ncbi:MAG: DegT/DnrJ/EryC1/StrS family aminotransferase [Deltaproteobacteria bacterium]|nr:DegT/DnrJ/EryC1/StrS family aminotransferase [Deltaproteobacteria bacterium]
MIPTVDPRAQYMRHKAALDAALQRVLTGGVYVLGDCVKEFESQFATFIGVEFCVGVANGTDAISIALLSVGVRPGDEVITVSHTAVATVAAISSIGAIPVLVDIEPESGCISPSAIAAAITEKTRAVVPVHMYGQPADMVKIVEICLQHNLLIVEDCAQAHGARIGTKVVGSFGHAASFSFYPTKNLGALGDGGAIVTNSPEVAEQLRLRRQYGWRTRYISSIEGSNSRLDEIQAAVLLEKLPYVEGDNRRRREIASLYNEALKESGIEPPRLIPGRDHAMHLYVVQCDRREEFRKYLGDRGISTALHYPAPVHLQPAYARLSARAKLRVTEALYEKIVTLPMFPELDNQQISIVSDALAEWQSAS